MIKDVSFDTKEYKHGISLWIKIGEHRKLLGSTFKTKDEVNVFILNMATQWIKQGWGDMNE